MGEQAEISFRANVSQLRQQLATLPGITAGEAQRMVIALERQMLRAEKAAKEAAKATAKAARESSREVEQAAKKAKEAREKAEESAKKAADMLGGGIFGDVEDLTAGFAGLRTGSAAALAPIAALGAAFVTLSGGKMILQAEISLIAGVASGLVNATLAAKEFVRSTEKFKDIPGLTLGLEPDQMDALDGAAAAVEALQVLAEKASAQIGVGFAPALQAAATAAVAAGLAFNDFLGSIGRGLGAFQKWRDSLEGWQKAAVDAAVGSTGPLSTLILKSGELSESLKSGDSVFGDYGKRASELVGQLVVLNREEERSADSAKAAADAQKAAADALRQHNDEMKARASLLGIQTAATADLLTAEDKIADAYLASQEAAARAYQSSAMGAQAQALYEQTLGDIELRRLRDTDALRQQTAAAEVERQKRIQDAEWKRLTETAAFQADLHRRRQADALAELDLYTGSATQIAGLVQGVADVQIAAADKTTKAGRRRAREWFNLQKAAALTEIGINAAVGVSKALAQLGPVAGAIASAGIVASGAAQAAKVASQKPSYHQGGEVQANVLQGEHVVRQGPAEAYRPELNELNRTGQLPARSSEMRLRRKDADAFVFEILEMPGGRTRSALNRGFLLSAQGAGVGLRSSGYTGRG